MIQPTFPDSKRIKEYHGLFTQTGTSNPVVTILHNTIGTITWTRTGLGIYTGTSDGLFTLNKTLIEPYGGNTAGTRIVISPGVGTFTMGAVIRADNINEIVIRTFTSVNANNPKEYSDVGNYDIMIKINVYE